MRIKIHLVNDNKLSQLDLPKSTLALDTLKELGIPPDTVIITRDGRPIPLDAPVADGDELAVIRVISGG